MSDMSDTVSVIRVFPPWLLWHVSGPLDVPFRTIRNRYLTVTPGLPLRPIDLPQCPFSAPLMPLSSRRVIVA